MQPVLGASLLSAAASLPLHLMPFLVAALVSDSRVPVAQAGWIASAYVAGQLACTFALPLLGVQRLSRKGACVAAAVAAAAPWLGAQGEPAVLLSQWFFAGMACGALQFLGATAAAAAADKPRAFAWRLCAILLVSSGATLLLGRSGSLGSYGPIAWALSLLLAALGVLGTLSYRAPSAQWTATATAVPPGSPWLVLVVVLVVFAAQPGFWTYAVHGAQQRGLHTAEIGYAVAACKVLSAVVLAAAVYRPRQMQEGLLWPGVALAAGVLIISGANRLDAFLAGALLREIGVNLLSVRFQAAVVIRAGPRMGPWLACTILAGATIGPALHGFAIEAGVPRLFTAFACLSALLPFAWSLLPAEPRSGAVALDSE